MIVERSSEFGRGPLYSWCARKHGGLVHLQQWRPFDLGVEWRWHGPWETTRPTLVNKIVGQQVVSLSGGFWHFSQLKEPLWRDQHHDHKKAWWHGAYFGGTLMWTRGCILATNTMGYITSYWELAPFYLHWGLYLWQVISLCEYIISIVPWDGL